MEKLTVQWTGWTTGLSSTGVGGSPGLPLWECSSLKYLEAELSDNSLMVSMLNSTQSWFEQNNMPSKYAVPLPHFWDWPMALPRLGLIFLLCLFNPPPWHCQWQPLFIFRYSNSPNDLQLPLADHIWWQCIVSRKGSRCIHHKLLLCIQLLLHKLGQNGNSATFIPGFGLPIETQSSDDLYTIGDNVTDYFIEFYIDFLCTFYTFFFTF